MCGFPMANREVSTVTHIGQLSKPSATEEQFFVREDIRAEDPNFIATNFIKYDSSQSEVTFFIEEGELNRIGDIAAQNLLSQLKSRMFDSTLGGQYNPGQGFYQNEIELFGDPPDVDDNGKIFILLLDIADEFDPETGGNYVAGYFDPLDQVPESDDDGSKNQADILYIDTNPGLSQNFEQTITTAAHELQHLLHFGADPNEAVWINEGMSEVTAHLFGLQARSFSHFLSNPTRTLTEFDYEAEDVINDYSKVGLWTLYLYTQYGENLLKDIVRSGLHGIPGLNSVFNNSLEVFITFNEVFANWVVANIGQNYLPDGAPEFKYGEFTIPTAEPALTISSFPAIDNRSSIKNYAASYIRLIGGDITSAEIHPLVNLTVDATLVLSDGESFDLFSRQNVNGDAPSFSEYQNYENAWLILSAPVQSIDPISGSYSLTVNGTGTRVVETLDYSSEQQSTAYIQLIGGTAATVFTLPSPDTEILSAEVNLHGDSSVTLEIAETLNGSALDSHIINNPITGWNTWQPEISTDGFSSIVLKVSTDSTGLAFDDFTEFSGNSYFKYPNGTNYIRLVDVSGTGSDFNGNWDMRLTISYPGQPGTMPGEGISVRPNPWIMSSEQHGSTVYLRLSFEEQGDVNVDIFNLLGQRVKELANESVAAGQILPITWDGTNSYGARVSSGLYFIMVRKDNQQEVKKLTVIW